jgi:hypothetical protein
MEKGADKFKYRDTEMVYKQIPKGCQGILNRVGFGDHFRSKIGRQLTSDSAGVVEVNGLDYTTGPGSRERSDR